MKKPYDISYNCAGKPCIIIYNGKVFKIKRLAKCKIIRAIQIFIITKKMKNGKDESNYQR